MVARNRMPRHGAIIRLEAKHELIEGKQELLIREGVFSATL